MFVTMVKFLLLFCSLSALIVQAGGQVQIKERNILINEAGTIELEKNLITDHSWIRMPGYTMREFWDKIPGKLREEYISRAEKYLDYDWPVVKATDYLEFIRSGDRRQVAYAAPSNVLNSLVMGELVEGNGRFIDQIINGVWYYSEQTWWGWSAHLYFQKAAGGLPDINEPTIDLGVGEIANDLSWIWYLFKDEFDKVHPLISRRLKQEITGKAITPYYERNDFGYLGFRGGRVNNWNPWVNYNMLNAILLVEDDPVKKKKGVLKIVSSLDKFINGYSDDGGCDEGPSYWGVAGAVLYESLAVLKDVSAGKFDVFDNSLIGNIGKYFYKVNIHAPYFINFADADAVIRGNPSAVYLYGKSINDTVLQKFGAHLARINNWGDRTFSGKICDQIKNLKLLDEILNSAAEEALVADFWLPGTEVGGARDNEGSYTGFFFGAKGGFNAESHNHNDVGSCVMYYDGKPCLIDLGREGYTAKTFGSRRYEIWTMQSGYHNLPVINGTEQPPGGQYKAKNSSFTANNKKVVFSTDISGAYPEKASVESWIRSYRLVRGRNFTISDLYVLNDINEGSTSSNLMTCCRVTKYAEGSLRFDGDGFSLKMSYNPRSVDPEIQFIEVKDPTLQRYWPDGVTRVVLKFRSSSLKGSQDVIFTPVK
jgi:hypothetical protein